MQNIIEKPGFNGGLVYLGELAPQKFCYRVKLTTNKIYLICSVNQTEIMAQMDTIKKLKIDMQRANGLILVSKNQALRNNTLEAIKHNREQKKLEQLNEASNHNRNSGKPYWMMTQGWSTCDKKCGGGTQTLQRICIKPEGKGECKGKGILTKPCNEEPCPTVIDLKTQEKEKQMVAKPIVKVMPFSKRYQKYIVR